MSPAVQICPNSRREQRSAEPSAIERRNTQPTETDRRQIPFGHDLHKIRPAKIVDGSAGKTRRLVVAFFSAVIDPVVAESAEIEIGERFSAIAEGNAGGTSEPDRRMVNRQGNSVSEIRYEARIDFGIDKICRRHNAENDSLLVIDGSERTLGEFVILCLPGDGHRYEQVKTRSQTYNPKNDRWVKRNSNSFRFISATIRISGVYKL